MMDQNSLEKALAGLALGSLRYFAQVGSTNTEALRWADAGAPDLSLVVADEQTTGRGRQGRKWLTPPGTALAFSLALRQQPETSRVNVDSLARLTGLGALAVCQALEQLHHLTAQIKWPNDVLLDGRKVCGILAEAQWQDERPSAVILGIGVNVAPGSVPPESEVLYPAACIESVLGQEIDRWQLLRSVLENILAWRERLDLPEFLHAWEERLAFKGQWVYIYTGTDTQGPPDEQGVLLGLDAAGSLRIRVQSGEVRSLNVGELRLRPANRVD